VVRAATESLDFTEGFDLIEARCDVPDARWWGAMVATLRIESKTCIFAWDSLILIDEKNTLARFNSFCKLWNTIDSFGS
jgi:hypothetical protein